LRADALLIRAQSTIRADGFTSAQQPNSVTAARVIWIATQICAPGIDRGPGRDNNAGTAFKHGLARDDAAIGAPGVLKFED